jgi:hypothetical protein
MTRGTVVRRGFVALLVAGSLLAPTAAGADEDQKATSGSPVGDDVGAQAAPANDAFADAETITGGAGTLTATVVDATVEPDEPDPLGTGSEHSTWYEWTPPATGTVMFDTQGSDIDTVLSAHTGPAVDDLTTVAENDDFESLHSQITFEATNGTTYLIRVAGFGGWEGLVSLTWHQLGAAPANDDFAAARLLADNEYGDGVLGYEPGYAFTSGTAQAADREAGEPTHVAGGDASVWFSWTAAYTDEVLFWTSDVDWDTDPVAYTGAAVGALTPVTDLDPEEEDLRFAATAGTTYHIALDAIGGGGGGGYELRWARFYDPPTNDHLADAQAITGASGEVDGTTVGATYEDGEPDHADGSPDRSVWYSWTAPTSGPVQMDTWDSPLAGNPGDEYPVDTLLAVYTGGPGLLDLVAEASNDEFPDEVSRVRFDAVAGTTYLIAVDDDFSWPGIEDFTLTWGPYRAWFSDVSPSHPFADEIDWMLEEGISIGYQDGTFRPAADVTRQAMSAFMYGFDCCDDVPEPSSPTFSDVSFSHPFIYEIEWMAWKGISTGYADGTYRPSASVTRQAMSAFMFRLADSPASTPPGTPTFSDVGAAHPFYDEVEWMADEEITTGYQDGTFRPSAPVTRQAMSAFLFRLDQVINPPPP